MRGRPTWQGHLKLSLVTCPVALYAGEDTNVVDLMQALRRSLQGAERRPPGPRRAPEKKKTARKAHARNKAS